MNFKNISIGIVFALLTGCITKTPLTLGQANESIEIYRSSDITNNMLRDLKPLGDIELSQTDFSEKKAADDNFHNILNTAKKMGAKVLIINTSETTYNPLTGKYKVLINATAYQ